MSSYVRPSSLPDALALLGEGRMILAGGTDIFPATEGPRLTRPVVDVSGLPEARGIGLTPKGLRIGACTTWAEIVAADLPPACDALRTAAAEVGGRQIQQAGTIGGNLCNASPAADGVPPLLILNAEVELTSTRETRRMPLGDFLTGPRLTARRPDELLLAIHIPRAALAGQSVFLKLGARAYLVISIVMVAARIAVAKGAITDAALAVGACSATARRLPEVECALRGMPASGFRSRITNGSLSAALTPLDDLRGTAAYRRAAALELLHRAVGQALERAA